MKRRALLGTHLYGQIVYPLLAASVVVGVVATLVAVYFLQDLTNKWVAQVARSSTESAADRFAEYTTVMGREAALVANSTEMRHASESEHASALQPLVVTENAVLGFDGMLVLDRDGRVVAGSTSLPISFRGRPFKESVPSSEGAVTRVTTLAGFPSITRFQPIPSDADLTLALTKVVDDRLLDEFGVGASAVMSFFDGSGNRLALSVGDGFDPKTRARIEEALKSPDAVMLAAVDSAQRRGVGQGTVRIGSVDYQVWVERLALPGSSGSAGYSYLAGIVSQSVSEQAGRTTRNLIAMWSIVAVVALVGLGGWVARRVSDPLVELSLGARRIADGDFTTKVPVVGANEVADLASTFNEMTDSLKDRSETLTKKVLELATLYEMSRALGSTLDLDELLGSVLDSALRIFDLDLGYVALRDRDTGTLSIRAVRGGESSGADGAVRSSMSEWVVREGRPLIFNPDAGSKSGQIDTVTGARAALCVPLISAEGTIGSVAIGSSSIEYRFNSDDVRLLSTIANHVTIAIGNIELFSSLQEAYLATVRSLAAAVDAKDSYTRGHSDRVAQYGTMIAEHMGLSHDQRIALEMAAYLHDIGKIGVKEGILLKPGRLDDDEMAQMRHHPLIGANILKPVAFPWAITPVVRHHHESYDGAGYPAGLKGEEIPLLARILTVADSYEAMTADRPYRQGRSPEEALEELRKCSGSQFDPRIVDVFTEIVRDLEGEGVLPVSSALDDIAPEEARAIFSAIVDGVFVSFRRLGGPRLAANVEHEVDAYFEREATPFRIVRGRLSFTNDVTTPLNGEDDVMRDALRHIDTIMSRVSGVTLVEHFYTDAFSSLSGRMREAARRLGFYSGA